MTLPIYIFFNNHGTKGNLVNHSGADSSLSMRGGGFGGYNDVSCSMEVLKSPRTLVLKLMKRELTSFKYFNSCSFQLFLYLRIKDERKNLLK